MRIEKLLIFQLNIFNAPFAASSLLLFLSLKISKQLTINVQYKFAGVEPRTSVVGSVRSTNWATTTAH